MRGLRKFFGIYVREVEGEGFDTKFYIRRLEASFLRAGRRVLRK